MKIRYWLERKGILLNSLREQKEGKKKSGITNSPPMNIHTTWLRKFIELQMWPTQVYNFEYPWYIPKLVVENFFSKTFLWSSYLIETLLLPPTRNPIPFPCCIVFHGTFQYIFCNTYVIYLLHLLSFWPTRMEVSEEQKSCLSNSVRFSHSVVSDSLRSHELQHARPPCPSPTPGVHSDSHPLSRWCHTAISSCVVPFSSWPNPSQHQNLF